MRFYLPLLRLVLTQRNKFLELSWVVNLIYKDAECATIVSSAPFAMRLNWTVSMMRLKKTHMQASPEAVPRISSSGVRNLRMSLLTLSPGLEIPWGRGDLSPRPVLTCPDLFQTPRHRGRSRWCLKGPFGDL